MLLHYLRIITEFYAGHQGSTYFLHRLTTGFGPFNFPTRSHLRKRRDHSLVGVRQSLLDYFVVVYWYAIIVWDYLTLELTFLAGLTFSLLALG